MRRKERAKKRKQETQSCDKVEIPDQKPSTSKRTKSEDTLFKASTTIESDATLEKDGSWGEMWPFANFIMVFYDSLSYF